ncbi:MAG: hypothetical protein ACODAD_01225 [Planctomycetota bacterium]
MTPSIERILKSPYASLPAAIESVAVEGGFRGPRITTNATVTVPHNFKFLETTRRLKIFDRAAGLVPKSDAGGSSVGDSDVFKIIEGTAYTHSEGDG